MAAGVSAGACRGGAKQLPGLRAYNLTWSIDVELLLTGSL
jgi:hypothetical protein